MGRAVLVTMVARRKNVPAGSNPVYFEDRGAIYDAPLDVVWDFWRNDETYHPNAHTSAVRNFRTRDLSEVTTLVYYEALEAGKWEKRACRMTTIPPAVRVQEDLKGPGAGSIKVYVYSPRGSRTAVDVLCWMRSTKLTPKQIKSVTRKVFAKAFHEDLPWFQKYVNSRRRKG
jgi:hypothetical protein